MVSLIQCRHGKTWLTFEVNHKLTMVNIVNHFDTIHPWMTRMVEVGQMGALRGQISEDWHLW